jgi:hypothetical protein
MTRKACLGATLVVALSIAGCGDTILPMRQSFAAGPGSAGPSKSAGAGSAEETVRVWVPEAGYVRGTRDAVGAWGMPLKAAAGPNRTVEACRAMVWGEAEKLGARTVEAVSAGPHRRNLKGEWVAPVRMQVTYARPDGLEVKEATMTCIVDRENRIVDGENRIVNAFT